MVLQELNEALTAMDGPERANAGDPSPRPGEEAKRCRGDGRLQCKVYQDASAEAQDEALGKKFPEGSGSRTGAEKAEGEEPERAERAEPPGRGPGGGRHGNGLGLDDFKAFLRGTAGDKLLNLWMDIERLRSTGRVERKNR